VSYQVVLVLDYDPVWTALKWAQEHCPSYITIGANGAFIKPVPGGWVRQDRIVYYFGEKHDAAYFKLRWGG
jgi:hypothetical protein